MTCHATRNVIRQQRPLWHTAPLIPTYCTISISCEGRRSNHHCHSERKRRISRVGVREFFAHAQNDKRCCLSYELVTQTIAPPHPAGDHKGPPSCSTPPSPLRMLMSIRIALGWFHICPGWDWHSGRQTRHFGVLALRGAAGHLGIG